MVQMASAVSGHTFNLIRERLADKAEVIKFDPFGKLLTSFSTKLPILCHFSFQCKFDRSTVRKRRFAACKNVNIRQSHFRIFNKTLLKIIVRVL